MGYSSFLSCHISTKPDNDTKQFPFEITLTIYSLLFYIMCSDHDNHSNET